MPRRIRVSAKCSRDFLVLCAHPCAWFHGELCSARCGASWVESPILAHGEKWLGRLVRDRGQSAVAARVLVVVVVVVRHPSTVDRGDLVVVEWIHPWLVVVE